ncbi:hypothetical protein ACFFWD_01430 [Bradyrhizobium erythrophlei]|uniref:hypothetical protein n=1 Tax=Bradyrhizobium erythrophlei TaxID=1437360 RepID=UPI0035EABFAA
MKLRTVIGARKTRGDYWLTQQICQSICLAASVTKTTDDHRLVEYVFADIRHRVVERLQAAYYPAVKEFCRGRRFRPSNDPYFKLLREVGQQDSSIIDLNEMANSRPEVRGSINNIKEHRLPFKFDQADPSWRSQVDDEIIYKLIDKLSE